MGKHWTSSKIFNQMTIKILLLFTDPWKLEWARVGEGGQELKGVSVMYIKLYAYLWVKKNNIDKYWFIHK